MAAGGGTLPGGETALMCQVTVLGDPSVVPGVAAQDAAQWMSSWAVTDAQNTGWLLLIPFLPSSLGCLHKLSWIYIFNDRVLFFFLRENRFCGTLPISLTKTDNARYLELQKL